MVDDKRAWANQFETCPCGDGLRPGHPMGWCDEGRWLRPYRGAGTHPLDHEGPFSNLVGAVPSGKAFKDTIDHLERTLENNAALRARLVAWECFEPPTDDYEALGYPETDIFETDLDCFASVARYFYGTIDLLAFEKRVTDKKNDDDTDNG